ncbi:hypothetical protein NLI96_g5734 [Meripilus lineatus]|uniref:Uncharacterized protein n=1 Tax=Meripilus lineatus TaxID=2056292 RepID=A0AAD5YEK2_9APHY|nr:hypothetical protein NLI96_g5734 [Physisporinus lineatus]
MSFFAYVLAEPQRLRGIHHLSFLIPSRIPGDQISEMAHHFTRVLRGALCLRSLWTSESILHDVISNVLSDVDYTFHLPSLGDLRLDLAGKQSVVFLQRLKAPLRRLRLWLSIPVTGLDVFSVIDSFRNTLEVLDLQDGVLGTGTEVQFPCIRAIRMVCVTFGPTVFLVSNFPKLQHLMCIGPADDSDVQRFLDEAEINRSSLRGGNRHWEGLNFLSGRFSVLYGLGLNIPIRYLDIFWLFKDHSDHLLRLLRDLRPECLDLDVCLKGFTWAQVQTASIAIARSERLRYLILGIEVIDHTVNVMSAIDILMSELRHSSITFMALYALSTARGTSRPHRISGDPTLFRESDPIRHLRKGASTKDVALRFAKSAPSLTHIYMHDGTGRPEYWEVHREFGGEYLSGVDHAIGFKKMEDLRGEYTWEEL